MLPCRPVGGRLEPKITDQHNCLIAFAQQKALVGGFDGAQCCVYVLFLSTWEHVKESFYAFTFFKPPEVTELLQKFVLIRL